MEKYNGMPLTMAKKNRMDSNLIKPEKKGKRKKKDHQSQMG